MAKHANVNKMQQQAVDQNPNGSKNKSPLTGKDGDKKEGTAGKSGWKEKFLHI